MKNPIDYFYNEKGDWTITLHEKPILFTSNKEYARQLKDAVSSLTMRIDTITKLNQRLTKELQGDPGHDINYDSLKPDSNYRDTNL